MEAISFKITICIVKDRKLVVSEILETGVTNVQVLYTPLLYTDCTF